MEQFGIGVIGTGSIGQHHIRSIGRMAGTARVVAVNDINPSSSTEAAGDCGARIEADPHHLIRSDDVQAVIVTSWDPTHEEFVLACLEEGKYVFCEKPLSDNSAACRRIMEAEIAGGKRLLQTGFMRRFDQEYRKFKAVLDSRELGEVLLLHCRHRVRAPGGAKHTSDTMITRALSHEFDITRWLLGDEFSTAQMIRGKPSKYAHEGLSDPQMAILQTREGVCVDLEICMNARYGYEIIAEAVCEGGTIHLSSPSSPTIRSDAKLSTRICGGWQERFLDAYDVELREWIESVHNHSLSGPTAWDGYASCAVAEACVEAANNGSIIPVQIGACPEFYK